jgi:predicted membrane protein
MPVWEDEMRTGGRAAAGTLVSGLVIAGIGVVLLLDRFGIVNSDVLWHFWPLIFTVGGIIRLAESHSSRDQVWGAFLISIGCLLTLHEFGYIRFGITQLWPLFLIVAGLLLIWHSNEVREGRRGFSMPSAVGFKGIRGGPLGSVAFFGAIERRVEGTIVEGGDIVALFGGFKIDLSRAEMDGEQAVIDATAIFGGGEIIVPEWWRVSVEGVGIFGGYVDKTRHIPRPDRPVKTIVVRGAAVFGGIEVKSY